MSYQSITTLTRDRHPSPSNIQTRNFNNLVAADTHLSPRGHWNQPFWHLVDIKYSFRAPLCNSLKC